VGNGIIDGGTATWNTNTTNWTGPDGSTNAPWQSGFAVFAGTAGTVTLGENVSLSGAQFITTGYTIAGNGFTLAGQPATLITIDPSVSAVIDAAIVDGAGGPVTLTKTGAGTLTLAGINSYSGGTAINNGTLQVSSDANLGAASGALGFDGGTLATTASLASARSITLDTNGGSFAPVAATTLSLSGPVSGIGSLTKTDAGTLILSGSNSYAGGTFFDGGVLAVSGDANFGAANGALIFNGGTLRFDAGFDPASTRPVTLDALGGSIDTNGQSATLAQTIGGVGALSKLGAGTLTLTADNSYAAGTTIGAGTLQIGNGGTTGSIVGDVVDNGALVSIAPMPSSLPA